MEKEEEEEGGGGIGSGRSQSTIRFYLFSSILAKKRETPHSKFARSGAIRTQICSR